MKQGATMTSMLKLKYSIEVNGEKINQLQLRRPTVRDRLIAEKSGSDATEKEIGFIANLCQVAPTTIEALDLSDYLKLQEKLNDFLS
jgi:Phage tail assembly chaperone proteins, E, or 41 or 14